MLSNDSQRWEAVVLVVNSFPLICGERLGGKCDADLPIRIWRERDARAGK
jgi:hypothetical protein